MSAEYRALVDKVEVFVASTTARRGADLHCQKGCEACCHVSLRVGPIEAAAVREGLRALPAEARARARLRGQSQRPHGEEPRCALLEDDGSCAIYAQRPLVCRSQGQALRYPEGFVPEQAVRMRTRAGHITWCPLNYTAAEPRGEDVLDAERVDQILAVVTRRQVASPADALVRTSLSDLAAEQD
jgi:Fe-S-cluster containining protein